MLSALIEGAAGISDNAIAYRDVTITPQWPTTTDVRDAYVIARYASGDGYVAYRWRQGNQAIELDATGSAERTRIALPLPDGAGEGKRSQLNVTRNGAPAPYTIEQRPDSRYILLESPDTVIQINITW
jgi:hypothetical protein